ncbi:ABC transporter transmembrane domain-containing protein [Rhizobium sp. YS-1r]|uniref:ABC transporter transmembrane domain-containing protein n=1 Tax=Neorhizobium phenanthreniclasticum TaxID=3157917 RepID=A0ABV0M575_9HYPH|nr:ABC transporter transmembrane domain-containing protein [Rhizobium sp. YS-1r]KGD96859.1 ABC transporter ATPase [Rhizobium sp. YS-1r]
MEKNLLRYIWNHTRPQQIWVLIVVLVSMIPYFLSLDLPKQIINGPIQGAGFETPNATQPFMEFDIGLPLLGSIYTFEGFQLGRMQTLIALSGGFLSLVIINNFFKYYINTYKGRLGERLLRRIRFELFDRVLRFPPRRIKNIHGAEIASMIKDEVEPFGGFTGDAFVQPAMLGGQAVAAMLFILLQSFWLGLVAAVMVLVQVIIIPRMRRRLIELGRQRQITARHLAGKVGEVVEGIGTIHAYDTSNYERADVANRLGQIFKIRYDIYQWKFLVKFLNNFLAQLTPFFFYLIGGYFALRGSLDVGQLVAVINAYKDLPSPLKELIDWDQARQDVQVKYEQVRDYFEFDDLIDPATHAIASVGQPYSGEQLAAINLVIEDEGGVRVLNGASIRLARGESVAMADNIGRGAEALAEAFGRQVWPTSGKIFLGDHDILELPESIAGRRVSYVSADTYFFHGSLKDNLLYGLKHAPVEPAQYEGDAANQRRWEIREAQMASNPDFDVRASWVDHRTTSISDNGDKSDIKNSLLAALDKVQLTDDILQFALHSTLDAQSNPQLVADVVAMRHALHNEIRSTGRSGLIVPFEPQVYNKEATVGENLLFGKTLQPLDKTSALLDSDHFYTALAKVGLLRAFVDTGLTIAGNMVEIFSGLPPDHPFFNQVPFLTADDIVYYQQVLQKLGTRRSHALSAEEERAVVRLTLEYIEPRYRLGVLHDDLREKIVGAREIFFAELPAHLRGLIEHYDPDGYMSYATLQENILFGKIANRNADAPSEIRNIAARVSRERGFYHQLLRVGLEFDIGAGGRRLTLVQRQKLNLARALIRRSDFYIFNKPLPGQERRLQEEIVNDVLTYLRQQENNPTIVWVLSNISLSKLFERVVMFDNGEIVEDGLYETLREESGIFKALVA